MVQPLLHGDPVAAGPSVSRFEIHAEHCLHLFAKIIGLFATHSILPHSVHMRRSPAGMWLAIEATVAANLAERLAERVRGLVTVEAVIHLPSPALCSEADDPLATPARCG